MTYLCRPRKDAKPQEICCRSGVLIDVRDKKLVVKLGLTDREKKLNKGIK